MASLKMHLVLMNNGKIVDHSPYLLNDYILNKLYCFVIFPRFI